MANGDELVTLSVALLIYFKLPFVDYFFFIGVNVMQLSSLILVTIVVSSPKWLAKMTALRRGSISGDTNRGSKTFPQELVNRVLVGEV